MASKNNNFDKASKIIYIYGLFEDILYINLST